MSFTGVGSSFIENKRRNADTEGIVEELTREDEPPVSLENFTIMTNDMIVWNDNKRVLMLHLP